MGKFQSTHPSRGATIKKGKEVLIGGISIHAPLTGCDTDKRVPASPETRISIHAPLTGCDTTPLTLYATRKYFNPRTPHGVRHLCCYCSEKTYLHFNPRTPHGVRLLTDSVPPRIYRFQSTHPSRGATFVAVRSLPLYRISIHAPLTGCDQQKPYLCRQGRDFNPRTPHGVRQPTGGR